MLESLERYIKNKIEHDGFIFDLPPGRDLTWKNIDSTKPYWRIPEHGRCLDFKDIVSQRIAGLFRTAVLDEAIIQFKKIIENEGAQVLRTFCKKPEIEVSIKLRYDSNHCDDESIEKWGVFILFHAMNLNTFPWLKFIRER